MFVTFLLLFLCGIISLAILLFFLAYISVKYAECDEKDWLNLKE